MFTLSCAQSAKTHLPRHFARAAIPLLGVIKGLGNGNGRRASAHQSSRIFSIK